DATRQHVLLTGERILEKIATQRREAIIDTQINDGIAVDAARELGFNIQDGEVAVARSQLATAFAKLEPKDLYTKLNARSDPDRDDAKETGKILKPLFLESQLKSLKDIDIQKFAKQIGESAVGTTDVAVLAAWLDNLGITGRTLA